jgi:hypothetical protein
MTTIRKLGLLLLAAATSGSVTVLSAPAGAATPKATGADKPASCAAKNRVSGDNDTQETLNAIRSMKKDGGAGVPPEAQAILDQMTAMFENDDSRGSAEMADAMREFAGGRAPRRPRC